MTRFSNKLTLSYLLLFIAVSVFTEIWISRTLETRNRERLEQNLETQCALLGNIFTPEKLRGSSRREIHELTRRLAALISDKPRLAAGDNHGRRLAGPSGPLNARVTVIDPSGTVLGDSEKDWGGLLRMDNHGSRPEVVAALSQGVGSSVRYSRSVQKDMLYVALRLGEKGPPASVVRVSLPLTEVRELMENVREPIRAAFLAGTVLVILVSFLIGRYIRKKIGLLTEAAREFQSGRLRHRIPMKSGDELKLLADAMAEMAASLEMRIGESEREKLKLAVILNHLGEGVLAFNCAGRLMAMNPKAEALAGMTEGQAVGKTPIEVVRNRRLHEMMSEAIAGGTSLSEEIEIDPLRGTTWRAQCVGIDRCDERVCGIMVLTDITEQRKAENMRRDFVANVSHELKTPLTSLKGFIETLLGGKVRDAAQAERFLKIMEEDAERLSRLIDGLLDLSRIETGEIVLRREWVGPRETVARVISLLESRIRAKNLDVVNEIPEGARVWADPDRLKQVLMNLVDNALKFTRENGKVRVSAALSGAEVSLSVEDSGIGIREEDLDRVFERFYRADKGRSRSEGGTGLGLAIVKHIVEAHGGQVSCQSVPGQGSVFSFTLKTPL